MKVAEEHCPTLIPDTTLLFHKFKDLFGLFSKCHNIYDKNYVSSEETEELVIVDNKNVHTSCSFYR